MTREDSALPLTIAIDGPVGAGKSAIAQGLARTLGILHLDTGAMYRALALKALREGIDPKDAQAAEALAGRTVITIEMANGAQRTLLDGEDVSGLIRTPEVSAAASAVSTIAAVRAHMVALQQAYARGNSIVLDGRDIGTRVLPDASHKFYLDATPETRARRRYDEMRARGVDCVFEDVLSDLIARDEQDRTRAADPLRQADDARLVDTTALDEDGVLRTLVAIIQGKDK